MAKNSKRDEAYNLREIYQEMELELISSMKRNLTRHKKEELKHGFRFEQWQLTKLRDLERFRRANKDILKEYSEEIENLISETLLTTYKNSYNNVTKEYEKASELIELSNEYVDATIKVPKPQEVILKPLETTESGKMTREALENIQAFQDAPTPTDDTFFRSNDKKFDALMETVENDFKKANTAVLRRMDDIYRQTIFRTQVHLGQGTITLDQAIDRSTKDFLEKGIDAITYKDGKKVNIASYAEMALRTANHRSYLMGEGKKRQELGIPFVVVSAHATSCDLCIPWQGLILIDDVYSGGKKEDGPYPLLSEAMQKNFLHPNCRHNLSTYFHGITTLPKVPDMEGIEENYKREQQQRQIERQIRKYKRLEEGSIDENNIKEYQDKVKECQKAMREHLKDNPQLRRAYNGEQTRDVPFDYGQQYDELKGLTTNDNIIIEGVSHHFKLRAVERNVSSGNIENALINPLSIGKIKVRDNGKSKEYIGKYARVTINPDTGNIITVWETSSKLRKKFKGEE